MTQKGFTRQGGEPEDPAKVKGLELTAASGSSPRGCRRVYSARLKSLCYKSEETGGNKRAPSFFPFLFHASYKLIGWCLYWSMPLHPGWVFSLGLQVCMSIIHGHAWNCAKLIWVFLNAFRLTPRLGVKLRQCGTQFSVLPLDSREPLPLISYDSCLRFFVFIFSCFFLLWRLHQKPL